MAIFFGMEKLVRQQRKKDELENDGNWKLNSWLTHLEITQKKSCHKSQLYLLQQLSVAKINHWNEKNNN